MRGSSSSLRRSYSPSPALSSTLFELVASKARLLVWDFLLRPGTLLAVLALVASDRAPRSIAEILFGAEFLFNLLFYWAIGYVAVKLVRRRRPWSRGFIKQLGITKGASCLHGGESTVTSHESRVHFCASIFAITSAFDPPRS